jgi:hypothetical protein
MRIVFDSEAKIDLLEFLTNSHEEFVPLNQVIERARPLHEWQKSWHAANTPGPDGKSSPEMNKKGKPKPFKSPANPPPEIDLPMPRATRGMGMTENVVQFCEVSALSISAAPAAILIRPQLAETLSTMNPLIQHSQQNPSLAPTAALDHYVAQLVNAVPNGIPMHPGQRTPGGHFITASPSAAHLSLPDGSPHLSQSPALGHMQAPNMALQQSQQGTASSGPSANTSPNTSNKRRRASGVNIKPEDMEVNGTTGVQGQKVKPSPRIGGKRQKPA